MSRLTQAAKKGNAAAQATLDAGNEVVHTAESLILRLIMLFVQGHSPAQAQALLSDAQNLVAAKAPKAKKAATPETEAE